jgi:hypothetical protein
MQCNAVVVYAQLQCKLCNLFNVMNCRNGIRRIENLLRVNNYSLYCCRVSPIKVENLDIEAI